MTASLARKFDVMFEAGEPVAEDRTAFPGAVPVAPPAAARPVNRAPSRRLPRYAYALAVFVLLVCGFVLSARQEFTPEEGVGYWLGIIGGCTLLFLLAYPMRKRFRFMSRAGAAPMWFRLHMVLGTVGPVLILYHSGFSLGATNSNVALFSMLAVASSGIVGRYLYGKIHNGLYGARSNLQDLLGEATSLITQVERDVGGADGSIAAKLTEFGGKALKQHDSLLGSLVTVVTLAFTSRFFAARIISDIRAAILSNTATRGWTAKEARLHQHDARLHVSNFISSVVKASELSLYERLFSMWHIFHVPLFFLLIITGIIHVVSVHLY